ncbi:restriction endonuclease subunit S [Enterococcus faecalis]
MKYDKLGNLCLVKGGKRLPKGKALLDYKTEHPYLRITDYASGNIDLKNLKYISNDVFDSISKYTINKKDIFLSIVGTIGIVDIIDEKLDGASLTENAVKIIVKDRTKIDVNYLAYYLKSTMGQYEIDIRTVGSTQKKLAITRIKDIPVPVIEINKQRKIASVLSSLDSKIKLNNQIISNLEELSSTLFKRWFVDFEFPDKNGNPYKSSSGKMVDSELGEIPEGWKVNKIGNMDIVVSDHVANGSFKSLKENVKILEDKSYALFLRNVDLKAELRGTLRYIDKASYDFLKKTHLFGGEVIISNVGDVGTVHLVPKNDKKMVLGNNQIYLNSNIENMNTYLYLFFKSVKGQELIKSITSGSVQMKFNKTDFRNLKIVFPLLDNFNIFSGLLANIRVKKNENNILRDTRDSLLPKLLSGEIELPEDEEV